MEEVVASPVGRKADNAAAACVALVRIEGQAGLSDKIDFSFLFTKDSHQDSLFAEANLHDSLVLIGLVINHCYDNALLTIRTLL